MVNEFKHLRLQASRLRRQNRQARLARVEKLHPGTIVKDNGVRKFKSRVEHGLRQEKHLSKTRRSRRSRQPRRRKRPPTEADIANMKKLLRRENGRANREDLFRDGSPEVIVDSETGALKSASRVAHGEAMAGFLPVKGKKASRKKATRGKSAKSKKSKRSKKGKRKNSSRKSQSWK